VRATSEVEQWLSSMAGRAEHLLAQLEEHFADRSPIRSPMKSLRPAALVDGQLASTRAGPSRATSSLAPMK
jgi:hypothetical protein